MDLEDNEERRKIYDGLPAFGVTKQCPICYGKVGSSKYFCGRDKEYPAHMCSYCEDCHYEVKEKLPT